MIEELVIYPDKRIEIPSPDVRAFDAELSQIIINLKDTIEHHDTQGLAAIQCAIPAAVLVIKKEDGSYLEMVNPRILKSEGQVDSIEQTLYLPGVTATIPRYEKIKVLYQDAHGLQQSLDAEGKLSLLLQRKIDYIYGGSFATKLAQTQKKDLNTVLRQNGMKNIVETCPTTPMKKDFVASFMSKLLGLGFILVLVGFFTSSITLQTLYTSNILIMIAMCILIIVFYFVGLSDSKKYRTCTSCQVGNLLGTMVKYGVLTLLLLVLTSVVLT